ncbi:MAG: TonB-dependent receptor plug, partial [Gemmatimonadetes bacterium]|nr:TonB-dependent receptor plug [Gemmatimonadota bacterium]
MRHSSRLRWVRVVFAGALFLAPVQAHSQGARISGVVRDAQGNTREGVRVSATSTATGVVRSSSTGTGGSYAISGLTPDLYTVTASLVGYRRGTRFAVDARAGDATVNFDLELLPLQAVVVTATLREQELFDVPFSVAAPSATVLRERGADNIETIAANVAGFTVQNLGPGQSQVAMRGTSSGQIARDQPGVKEQVGAYLDDSPISLSLFTPDLDLFDISRVEVLRGPQGTLFGAGSLAGTVRYITNQPELGVMTTFGELGASASDGHGGGVVKLGANLPIGDKAAFRIAGYHNQFAGYMDAVQPGIRVESGDNDGRRTGLRAAVNLSPMRGLTIVPRLVYQDVKMNGWNRIDTFNILANPYTTSRPKVTLGERRHFTQIGEPFTDKFTFGDLNGRYDFGAMNVTSVTSFAYRDILVVRDAGALTSSITGGSLGLPANVYTLDAPLNDVTKAHVFTQELRLAGGVAGSSIRWLIGGFYSGNKRGYGQHLLVNGFEAASGIPTKGLRAAKDELFYSDLFYDLKQSAAFGEATIEVVPRFNVTGGLRWYHFDEKREQFFDGLFANDDNGKTVVSTPGNTKANGLAPRIIASFRASDELTLNAQAAKGFRLGGINDPLNVPLCTAADLATFRGRDSWKDETAWNYEVGAKTLFMNGKASFNASAFLMDIRDLQLIVTAGSCSSRLVFNVPKAVSRGLELELAATPMPWLDFAVSGTFNNSELRSTLTSTDAGGVVSVVSGIKSGNRLPSVPQVQAAGAATIRRIVTAFGPRAQGFLTGSVQYAGSRYTQIDDLAQGAGVVDLNSFGNNTIGRPLTQSTFTFD